MSSLQINHQSFARPDGSAVLVVGLRGNMDEPAVGMFKQYMESLLHQQWFNVVLDCAQLRYICSDGMSQLVELQDRFGDQGGRIDPAGVWQQIYQLFEQLGLTSVFMFHRDVPSALSIYGINLGPPPRTPAPVAAAAHAQPVAAPAHAYAQPTAGFAPPPAGVAAPAAYAPPAKPATAPMTRTSPSTRGTQRIAPAAPGGKPKVAFPVKITCTNCSSKLRIAAAGKYKCPKCGIYYSVSEEARVKAYNTIKPRVIEMRVPTEEGFCESVRKTAVALASSPGMRFTETDRDAIEHGVDEATSLVVSKSAQDGRARFLQVYLVADEREFLLAIKLTENLIHDLENDQDTDIRMKLAMIRAHMTSMELINLPERGQILKLAKVAEGAPAEAGVV